MCGRNKKNGFDFPFFSVSASLFLFFLLSTQSTGHAGPNVATTQKTSGHEYAKKAKSQFNSHIDFFFQNKKKV